MKTSEEKLIKNPVTISIYSREKNSLRSALSTLNKMPIHKTSKSQSRKDEEEKRLFIENSDNHKNKSEMQLYSEFIKVFPIFKRTDSKLEVKYTYLIPNVEFAICPIKTITFGSSKLLSALEQKPGCDAYDFDDISNRSGYMTHDGRGKFIPYFHKDIKSKPISGIWIYNDTVEYDEKSKTSVNQLVQKS